jgi:hypothetical protein
MIYSSVRFRKKYQSSGIILSMKTQNSASPNWGLIPLSLKYLRRVLLPSSLLQPEVHSPHFSSTYAEFFSPPSPLLIQRFPPRIPRVPTTYAEFCTPPPHPLLPIQRYLAFPEYLRRVLVPSTSITYPETHSPHSPSTYTEFCTPHPLLTIQRLTPRIPQVPTQSFAHLLPHYLSIDSFLAFSEYIPTQSFAPLFPEIHSPHSLSTCYLRKVLHPSSLLPIQRLTPLINCSMPIQMDF